MIWMGEASCGVAAPICNASFGVAMGLQLLADCMLLCTLHFALCVVACRRFSLAVYLVVLLSVVPARRSVSEARVGRSHASHGAYRGEA